QDKRTFVRVYLRSTGGTINGVTAKLTGRRNGIELPESPLRATNLLGARYSLGEINVKPSPRRSELNDSFLFELPSAWRSGTIELEIKGISHPIAVCREPEGDGSPAGDCKVNVFFHSSPSPSVRLVGIIYTENGKQYQPSPDDI